MKKKTNLQILYDFLKGSKHFFIIFILSNFIVTLCGMLIPQIIRATIDNALAGEQAEFPLFVMRIVDYFGGFAYIGEHLYLMAAAVMTVAFVRAIAQYSARINNTLAAETFTKKMRDSLFSHIQKLPYDWHMKNRTGDIIQRCTSDVQTVRNFIVDQLTQLVLLIIKICMGYYFMFSMNRALSFCSLIPVPFIIVYVIIFGRQMTEGFTKCDETEGIVSSAVQENLTGVRVVRAFGREKDERERFEKINGEYTELWIKMGYTMGKFWSVQDVLTGIQTFAVLIIGAVFCVHGKMLAGEYVAFLSYNAMVGTPIRRVGRVVSEMSKAAVAIDRIAYIMNSEEEENSVQGLRPPLNADIEFKNITFSYGDGPLVLENVSFTIPAGSTLGILGGTGSGKSTLMLLLDKMYGLPEGSGSISIGGTDIKDIDTAYLRENISIVMQDPFLYSKTIGENIAIARPELGIEEIRRAADAACLDETVQGFAAAYNTSVGEKGVTLSGGQKQRTAIARALTKNAPIFIFDDSLSAVDTETDAKIRQSLERLFGSATIIIISHRITTLSQADNVLVLENGKAAEFGRPSDLQHSGGLYSRIYDIQSGNC